MTISWRLRLNIKKEHGIEADQEVNKLLFQSLKQHFAADLTYDKFINAYP
jgi:SecD/SecF fusion protein